MTLLTIKPSIIFSDLYDWAGQVRTVNISKKGTNFCPAENIERQAELILDRLKEQNYCNAYFHGSAAALPWKAQGFGQFRPETLHLNKACEP